MILKNVMHDLMICSKGMFMEMFRLYLLPPVGFVEFFALLILREKKEHLVN